jgi:hypothetical protein
MREFLARNGWAKGRGKHKVCLLLEPNCSVSGFCWAIINLIKDGGGNRGGLGESFLVLLQRGERWGGR